MNCKQVQALLQGYVDGELDLMNSLEIEEHLRTCEDCSRKYKELMALHSVISNASLYVAAPAHLERKIRSSVRKANPTRPNLSIFQWRWAAAAILVLVILSGAGLIGWFNSRMESAVVAEVQSAHIRSMMADHLTDVTSTDQHTVKPWFDGKLDFSPPVYDLAAQGYPLIGGRLDFLNGHQVAALVYQRNKHIINLFIWPSESQANLQQSSTNTGYNTFHWSQSGFMFWAVSDLNLDELRTFIALFQKNF